MSGREEAYFTLSMRESGGPGLQEVHTLELYPELKGKNRDHINRLIKVVKSGRSILKRQLMILEEQIEELDREECAKKLKEDPNFKLCEECGNGEAKYECEHCRRIICHKCVLYEDPDYQEDDYGISRQVFECLKRCKSP